MKMKLTVICQNSCNRCSEQIGKIVLTDADIVVSGGRGMKSPDNWAPLVELASLLGGATACSQTGVRRRMEAS